MTPDQKLTASEQAEAAGHAAAQAGEPIGKNPHSQAQGSPTRLLAIAWRRGYRQGELDQGDADGDLFRGTASR